MAFDDISKLDALHMLMRRQFFMAGRMTARRLWTWDKFLVFEAFDEVIKTNWESMADYYNAGKVDADKLLFWFGMGWGYEKEEITSGRVAHPEDNWKITEIEADSFATPPTGVNPLLN